MHFRKFYWNQNWLKFLFSHFFVVSQKILWRPLRSSTSQYMIYWCVSSWENHRCFLLSNDQNSAPILMFVFINESCQVWIINRINWQNSFWTFFKLTNMSQYIIYWCVSSWENHMCFLFSNDQKPAPILMFLYKWNSQSVDNKLNQLTKFFLAFFKLNKDESIHDLLMC